MPLVPPLLLLLMTFPLVTRLVVLLSTTLISILSRLCLMTCSISLSRNVILCLFRRPILPSVQQSTRTRPCFVKSYLFFFVRLCHPLLTSVPAVFSLFPFILCKKEEIYWIWFMACTFNFLKVIIHLYFDFWCVNQLELNLELHIDWFIVWEIFK